MACKVMTCGQQPDYGKGRAQEGGVMAPEKAGGGARGGARAGRSSLRPGRTLRWASPWSTSTPGALWRSSGSSRARASLSLDARSSVTPARRGRSRSPGRGARLDRHEPRQPSISARLQSAASTATTPGLSGSAAPIPYLQRHEPNPRFRLDHSRGVRGASPTAADPLRLARYRGACRSEGRRPRPRPKSGPRSSGWRR